MLHPDPFRDIDRLAAQLLGTSPGSARVPLAMPMDLYRSGDHYVLHADLPGVDPDSVDVSVDGGILTVKAQRSERTEHDAQWPSSERPTRSHPRRLSPGPDLDGAPPPNLAPPDGVQAGDAAGRWQCDALASSAPTAPGALHRGHRPPRSTG